MQGLIWSIIIVFCAFSVVAFITKSVKLVYDTLIRRSKLITAKYKLAKYIFFSLSGYTDWLESLADEDVMLLTLVSIYE